MPFSSLRWLRVVLALTLVLVVLTAPALAQQNSDDADQPWLDVPNLEYKKPWLPWLFGAIFIIGCVAIAFKNPHRSHLD